MTFVLASQNPGKLRELQAILAPWGIRAVPARELGCNLDVPETGATFRENARIKAEAILAATGLPAIADDSGLEVDALDGAPGVYSARYGGDACQSDAERCALLLQRLAGTPEAARGARFVCCIVCAFPDGTRLTAQGACPGRILEEPRGEGGFGYDPIFYLPELGCTMAQLAENQKNQISHRAGALRDLERQLNAITEEQSC